MSRFKSVVRGIGIALGCIGILALCLVGRIDRTPLADQPFYKAMMAKLDTLQWQPTPKGALRSDWTKVNITPARSMPVAGYTPRDGFDSVHDSLYARILRFDNGFASVLMINVDLLLFPPLLKERIESKLKEKKLNHFLYLAATHTHNGVGGWDDSSLGHWVLGAYAEEWVEKVAGDITSAVEKLNPQPASLGYWQADMTEWIENRIAFEKGEKDGMLRGLSVERADGRKAMLFTLSAHATSIGKRSRALSADYPAEVIRLVEGKSDFAMFMAGMVGSHRFVWSPDNDFAYVSNIGKTVYEQYQLRTEGAKQDSLSIIAQHVSIQFGASQMRIAKNWKVRNWVFRSLVNPLEGELTVLELGDVILVGTPCDFSGEIYVRNKLGELAAQENKQLIVTSFNGNYNGYITYDGHYDSLSKDEVRIMNWVGPYYGEYFSAMIQEIISK